MRGRFSAGRGPRGRSSGAPDPREGAGASPGAPRGRSPWSRILSAFRVAGNLECAAPPPCLEPAARHTVLSMRWDEPEAEREEGTATAARPRTRRPRRFRVLLHNDDFTTMEFVVHVLTAHFHMPPAGATQVMLQVHHKGVGVAGVYPRD